jgi:hypothetical protein
MPHVIEFTLSTGERVTHEVPVGEDPKRYAAALASGEPPFDHQWFQANGQTHINLNYVVQVRIFELVVPRIFAV